MMGTNRTPINRPPRSRVTPRSIEIFKAMREIKCSCNARLARCEGKGEECDRYWDCQGELGRELGLAPWQWPPIISPDQENVYPPKTAGGQWHSEGQALWRELERRTA